MMGRGIAGWLVVLRNRTRPVRQAWRRLRLTSMGVILSPGVLLGKAVHADKGMRQGRSGSISVGRGCSIGQGVVLHAWGGSIDLGSRVFVGPYSVLYGHGGITIGSNTLIAMHCRIVAANHDVPPAGQPIRAMPDQVAPIRIGSDVWLGAGVTVLAGVTIGDGCVVGAGAVVTTDLPPNSYAVGVPARVIRERESGDGAATERRHSHV